MINKNNDTLIQKLIKRNLLVGPGLGLVIMGVSYIVFWLMPFTIDAIEFDPRWIHNWAYAIIILTVGLSWFHKSPLSRLIGTVQAFMLPVTASGSFDTLKITFFTLTIALVWFLVVMIERFKKNYFLHNYLSKRSELWINMHTIIISWILIAHMGIVFFIGRVPLEQQLLGFGTYAGFLQNLPPENLEVATWLFDITLIIWVIIALFEQIKMGYNLKNLPWPRWSFWWIFICMVSGLLGVGIQGLIL